MDEIRIPFTLVVAIAFPPPGHPSRDGQMRHPSNGWATPGCDDAASLSTTEQHPSNISRGAIQSPIRQNQGDGPGLDRRRAIHPSSSNARP